MNKQRILVVDDDKSIVKIVRTYLEQSGYDVLIAYDGESALHSIRSDKPNLVVLDLMLPDRDGWDLTRLIRSDKRTAALPIIMLTARIEDTDKIIGLELGADDYITKPFNAREVVARVRALLRRTTLGQEPTEPILQIDHLQLDTSSRELTLAGTSIQLTPTEFNLLRTFMENPGHTYSREELLEKGMGYGYEGMSRTLDSHIANLRQKIELDARKPTYIQTVYGIGYRFVGNRS
ncbi:MAG: DNA-binding response regulator [Chloroflexi bacterium]|nr:MAG: DNA-binding response regulator [Chloroflexota bacterium]